MLKIVRCERLLDVRNGRQVENAVLIIDGSKLTVVGEESSVDLPKGVEIEEVDCSRKTVLPGLIDTHLHFALGAGANYEEMFQWPDSLQLVSGVLNARLTLESGVTTARDCGARNRVGLDLKEAAYRQLIFAPRLLVCGRSITMTGGHFYFCNAEADGYEGVRKETRRLIKEGVDFIKIMASGGGTQGTIRQRPSYSVEELIGATAEAHIQGKTVTAHCHATQAINNAVEAGVDIIEHCTFIEPDGRGLRHVFREDIAREMIRRGIIADNVVIATLDRDRLEWCFENFRELKRLGAKILAGTDGLGLYRTAGLAFVLEMMVRGGATPMEAIQAATIRSAETLGLNYLVGTLEPGKEADLMAVDGNPLEDIRVLRNPSLVMKGGTLIPRETTLEHGDKLNLVLRENERTLTMWDEVVAAHSSDSSC
jgi:imidazolonepropionase-like amidohydrolase